MKNLLILIIGLAAGAGGYWLFSHHAEEGEKKETVAAHEEKKGGDEGVIKLDAKQIAAAGIKVAAVQEAKLPREAKGYGRVLDPAPFITAVLETQTAEAAAGASQKEFERLRGLAQGQNASAHALETAEAAAKRDQTLVNLAQARLQTAFGAGVIGNPAFAEAVGHLLKMDWALVRIDAPSDAKLKLEKTVNVAPITNPSANFDAELLGPASSAELSIQGRGFLAILRTNALTPNTAIVARLQMEGEPEQGVIVPADALLLDGPEQIVFVEAGEAAFRRVEVEVARAVEKGLFVTEGISATNRVVLEGAHQLLSISKAESE
jgi:hypothetical protein